MPLTDSDFNNFASELTHRFAQRSKGLDPDSRRILAARPSDQILAGFLTPTWPEQSRSVLSSEANGDVESDIDDVEEVLADDLPRDSAYEQTALGLEWLVRRDQMVPGAEIEVELGLSVYVRRFPTFEEQSERKIWERTPF